MDDTLVKFRADVMKYRDFNQWALEYSDQISSQSSGDTMGRMVEKVRNARNGVVPPASDELITGPTSRLNHISTAPYYEYIIQTCDSLIELMAGLRNPALPYESLIDQALDKVTYQGMAPDDMPEEHYRSVAKRNLMNILIKANQPKTGWELD